MNGESERQREKFSECKRRLINCFSELILRKKPNKRYPFHMGHVIICVTKKRRAELPTTNQKFSPSTTKGTGIL
jgi:hypothetical protein